MDNIQKHNKYIWIINEYAGSPYHGMEFRHYYLAKELIKLGYKVVIISASYSHLFRNLPKVSKKFTHEIIDGIDYYWIRVKKYKNSLDKMRVLKWMQFSLYLLLLPFKKIPHPDAIILSPMATTPVLPTYLIAKIKHSKFIFEVKDIWPLSLEEIGRYSRYHPFIILLRLFELFALKKSDYIVSNLPNYGQHLKHYGINRDFVYIPNGIYLSEIQEAEPLDNEILEMIPKNKFIIGYAGTVGLANALEYLINAAKILEKNDKIAILIVGEGQEKKKLIELVRGLKNIQFIHAVQKQQVTSILKHFDVCYIGLRKSSLFEYGVSPNKIFDYMYSGKPIISSISTKKDLVTMAKCGISVEAENSKAIADAIIKLYRMSPEQRAKMGQNGKEYVLKYHTYEKLALQYKEIL